MIPKNINKEGFTIIEKKESNHYEIITEYISALKSGKRYAADSIKSLITKNDFEDKLKVIDQIFFNNTLKTIDSYNYANVIDFLKEQHKITSGKYNDFNIWSTSKTYLKQKNKGLIVRHYDLNNKVGFPDNGNGLYKSFLGEKNLISFIEDRFKNTSLSLKQYWLYSPGKNARKWEEFYKDGIIGLGWDKIGDLKQYDTRDEIKSALVNAYGGKGSKKNDVSANDDFLNKINIGDVIIAKKGRGEILGYGIVTSDYEYDKNRSEYQSIRKIDWILKGSWKLDFSLVLKTLTDITKYYSDETKTMTYYDELFNIMNQKTNNNIKNMAFAKTQFYTALREQENICSKTRLFPSLQFKELLFLLTKILNLL